MTTQLTTQFKSRAQSVKNNFLAMNLRKITTFMLIASIAVGIVTALFWYERVFLDEERRFWNAISTSMSTPSVVRTLTEGGTGNQVIQDYRFHFAPQQVIENKVSFVNRSSTDNVSIMTEGRVFPSEQYLRYTQFTNVDSQGNNVSDIDDLLGAWAYQKGQGQGESEEDSRVAYLSEYVTLAIFGNFDANYRNQVINEMRDNNVYGLLINEPTEQEIPRRFEDDNTQTVLSYSVSVNLRRYAEILNKSFEQAGYGNFPPLNPDNYREDQTVNGQIHISKDNGTIVGIDFGGREERYTNYGVVKNIDRPEYDRTVEELQLQVQEKL